MVTIGREFKTVFYYYRDRGERDSNGYKIQWLEIFVSQVKQTQTEITDYYHSGGIKKILSLEFQKGCGNREPQTELENNQQNRFYSESVEGLNYNGPTTEAFKELATLFGKMDKAEESLYKEGLRYEHAGDKFLNRVFLLKKIGAQQIDYSSQTHNYFLVA